MFNSEGMCKKDIVLERSEHKKGLQCKVGRSEVMNLVLEEGEIPINIKYFSLLYMIAQTKSSHTAIVKLERNLEENAFFHKEVPYCFV